MLFSSGSRRSPQSGRLINICTFGDQMLGCGYPPQAGSQRNKWLNASFLRHPSIIVQPRMKGILEFSRGPTTTAVVVIALTIRP